MKNWLIILSSLLLCCGIHAQQTISGKVLDATTSEGLVGAVVVADNGKYVSMSDVDGNYSLSVPDGQYIVQVKYIGYTCDSFPTTVSGAPIVHDFICMNSSMKEVVIVSD